MRRIVLGLSTIALVLSTAPSVEAQAIRAIGGTAMAAGDDNYQPSDYGFLINYYGAYSDAGQVCKNGYAILNYVVPSGTTCAYAAALSGSSAPNLLNLRPFYGSVLAPFFADINTNFGGQVLIGTGTVGTSLAWAATWDAVGGYAGPGTSSFQLALIDRGGFGDFDMEFNYGALSWGANGGIGFTNDEPVIVTNFTPTQPAENTRILCEFRDGRPTCGSSIVPVEVVPEPSTIVLMATGFAGLFGVAARRRRNSSNA